MPCEDKEMGIEESEAICQWQITSVLYCRTIFNKINERNKKKFNREIL